MVQGHGDTSVPVSRSHNRLLTLSLIRNLTIMLFCHFDFCGEDLENDPGKDEKEQDEPNQYDDRPP